jgi:prefoldin alpha subunit
VNEQEIKQALSTLELYRAQAESLAEQQQLIQMSLDEHTRARETLTRWKNAEPGAEILVPVGGNSFVFAQVAVNDKALVGVGSGVTIERPLGEAVTTIEARISEMVEASKKIAENLGVLESRSSNLTQMVQAEYDRLQQQQR